MKAIRSASGRRRIVAGILMAALVSAAVAVGMLGQPRDAAVPARERLRVAVSSTPHAALLYLAAAKGYFAREGLDVTLTPVTHGKAALDLLIAGKVDLAAAAEVPLVIAVLQGQQLDVAATVASVSTEMAIVARRNRGISAPADLVGRKIGATLGTSGEYFLWAFMARHRLPPNAVTLVDVAPGQIPGQLASGAIDAAATWQPVRLGAEAALGTDAVTFTEPDAYTVTHLVVGRDDFVRSHPATVKKLVRAVLQAEAFSEARHGEALALLADSLKIDALALQPTWKDLDFSVELQQSQLITLEDEARWAMSRGHAPKGPTPNFLPRLYLDALLAVRPDRVTVVH
jgi:NitT/TauT family transport system substrate-binding protein